MSGGSLYERYKDALKRGHVAALRGRLDEALEAYAQAARIAPERPTPHTSAGTMLLRRRRPVEAMRLFESALRIAPRDEAALSGRAQALLALGRRGEAADAYDSLAELRAAGGKLGDAVDAARRGLELAEGRERRRLLERLIERLRSAEPDEPARAKLERALQVLEGVAVGPHRGAAATGRRSAAGEGAATDAGMATQPQAEVPVEEPPVPPVRFVLDRDLPADLDIRAQALRAEEAIEAGNAAEAMPILLDLAAAYRRDERVDAALDVCYLGLSVAPDSAELHLALIQLYSNLGWTTLARDKLDLVARLADLDGDAETATQVAAARSAVR